MEYKGWAKVHIRPNPSDLPNGGKVELFIHNPITTTKMSDSRYEVNSTSGVLAYFVDYVLQDRVLTTISRSNSIQLSRDLKNVRRQWSLEDISGDFEDFTVIDAYTQLGKGGLEESGGIIGGYIVRSTINGAIVMLN